MSQLLEKLFPIIIILLLGAVLRRSNVFTEEAIVGIKNIILKIGLPAVLFSAFARSNLEPVYIFLFVIVFITCVLLYGIGSILGRKFPDIFDKNYTGGYFTGFEFGMVGIGLFTALWGIEKLPVILLIGLGHEFFIWFAYVPLLEYKKNGHLSIINTVISFLKSPIIIAIICGLLFNVLNLYSKLDAFFLGRSLLYTLTLLSNLVSPLILLIIGFSISLKVIPLKKALGYIISRWIFVGAVGGIAIILSILVLPKQDSFFIKAFIAFLILPPPYILPLFMKEDDKEKQSFFSDLLIYHTLTSFAGFIVLLLIS